MQQQYISLEDELKMVKKELAAAEEEKVRVLDELDEMKKVAAVANTRLSDALSSQAQTKEMPGVNELVQASVESAKKRDQAWQLELEAIQKKHALDVEALSSASHELERVRQELVLALQFKDAALKEVAEARSTAEVNAKKVIELSSELKSTKESLSAELEVRENHSQTLTQNDASFNIIRHELDSVKELDSKTEGLLSESIARVQMLEVELQKAKDSEAEMSEALNSQTKQLEVTKVSLEETKLEITSLHKKVQSLEDSLQQKNEDINVSHSCLEKAKLDTHSIKEVVHTLKLELQAAKEGQARAQEGEELALSKVRSLTQNINTLRTEVKLATDAEETNKNAMDDLALVLIEVSKENKELKERLISAQSELDRTREAADFSRKNVDTTEEKFQQLLDEARMEIDQVKSVYERLKLEHEDSILAWNQKELEFVNCIRTAEEDSHASKQENSKLRVSLRKEEEVANVAREENCKLRDILKQALNETSAAKEAAEIAREDNSELKDSLLDKDDLLQHLSRENERLRIKESAGHETIKELKRLLSSKSAEDLKTKDMDRELMFKKQNSYMTEHRDHRNIREILNLKFDEPQIPNGHKNEVEDPEMAEMLKGSIFDVVVSPDGPKPGSHQRKKSSSISTDDGEAINLEEIDHLVRHSLDDTEDKSSQRKKRALLRRFGELIKRTSFHKRESSVG
ncbi:Web family protein [Thalictrum thalictroides]|uniref:Web family protein n=1 Tax=Thalictrum thalictroides TaxID=46969 RepID=A0A7J6XFQ1_THATH|nr:Web family protein [Thalictrum thalictroides]